MGRDDQTGLPLPRGCALCRIGHPRQDSWSRENAFITLSVETPRGVPPFKIAGNTHNISKTRLFRGPCLLLTYLQYQSIWLAYTVQLESRKSRFDSVSAAHIFGKRGITRISLSRPYLILLAIRRGLPRPPKDTCIKEAGIRHSTSTLPLGQCGMKGYRYSSSSAC
jgi:hypothetical protein